LNKFQEENGCWLWKKPPPKSKKMASIVNPIDGTIITDFKPKTKRVSLKLKERILKGICSLVFHV
jgi:E3 ubiquitin-protein ligase UHRF1